MVRADCAVVAIGFIVDVRFFIDAFVRVGVDRNLAAAVIAQDDDDRVRRVAADVIVDAAELVV